MSRFALALALLFTAGCASPGLPEVGLGECRGRLRHGSYTLRVVDGPVEVTGSFVEGRKEGVFTIYTLKGTKVAEIPYNSDVKNGTIRLWYGETAFPGAAGRPKLEAEYREDLASGEKKTWWPSGAKQSDSIFRDGSLVRTEAWDEGGASLSRSEAKELSTRGAQADAEYYQILESEIEAHPPACTKATPST